MSETGKPKVVHLQTAPGYSEDDDSDAALWAAMRHHNKQRRTSRLIDFENGGIKELEVILGRKLKKHTDFHYSFMLNDELVNYYPSGGKWRYKNRTSYGNVQSLIGFVRKRVNNSKELRGSNNA